MLDNQGRNIRYLRLSVTDRCNFRCRYCMPAEGVCKREHSEMLSFEELTEIVRTAVSLGVSKVRLTGGEPLVRRGVPAPSLSYLPCVRFRAAHIAERAERTSVVRRPAVANFLDDPRGLLHFFDFLFFRGRLISSHISQIPPILSKSARLTVRRFRIPAMTSP